MSYFPDQGDVCKIDGLLLTSPLVCKMEITCVCPTKLVLGLIFVQCFIAEKRFLSVNASKPLQQGN